MWKPLEILEFFKKNLHTAWKCYKEHKKTRQRWDYFLTPVLPTGTNINIYLNHIKKALNFTIILLKSNPYYTTLPSRICNYTDDNAKRQANKLIFLFPSSSRRSLYHKITSFAHLIKMMGQFWDKISHNSWFYKEHSLINSQWFTGIKFEKHIYYI